MRGMIAGMTAALMALMMTAGCAKQPYTAVEAEAGKGMVYVYWAGNAQQGEPTFDVLLDGKKAGILHPDCYLPLQAPLGAVALTVRSSDPLTAAVEQRILPLDVTPDAPRYVKVVIPFEVSEPDVAAAKAEIADTVLWEDFDVSFHMAGEEADAPAKPAARSATDEIERLFALKEKGAITEAEYETLKARVLSGE